jgi:hypothetical protein
MTSQPRKYSKEWNAAAEKKKEREALKKQFREEKISEKSEPVPLQKTL